MYEDYGSDPRSVEEASQPPQAPNDRMISEQDLQAETKQCVTVRPFSLTCSALSYESIQSDRGT